MMNLKTCVLLAVVILITSFGTEAEQNPTCVCANSPCSCRRRLLRERSEEAKSEEKKLEGSSPDDAKVKKLRQSARPDGTVEKGYPFPPNTLFPIGSDFVTFDLLIKVCDAYRGGTDAYISLILQSSYQLCIAPKFNGKSLWRNNEYKFHSLKCYYRGSFQGSRVDEASLKLDRSDLFCLDYLRITMQGIDYYWQVPYKKRLWITPTYKHVQVKTMGKICCTWSDCNDYRGDLATTRNNYICQRWDEQSPHKHTVTKERYPYGGLEENYCRNPKNEKKPATAWCYTTDETKRWDYCDIPQSTKCKNACNPDYEQRKWDDCGLCYCVARPGSHLGEWECGSNDECWTKQVKVRLVDGNATAGRVEVKYEGEWGTICGMWQRSSWQDPHNDMFDMRAAKVICRQVGLGDPVRIHYHSYFGRGSGPIFLDFTLGEDVFCSGEEMNIAQCQHRGFNVHKCSHFDNVGVVCSECRIGEVKWYACKRCTCMRYIDDEGWATGNAHWECTENECGKEQDFPECCLSPNCSEYRGRLAKTESGIDCQDWSPTSPNWVHPHRYDTEKYPMLTGNFCRNPNGYEAPWCYTMDVNTRWEKCKIPSCQSVPDSSFLDNGF